jgi:hypothetical protein
MILTIVSLAIALIIFAVLRIANKKRSANFKHVVSNTVETYTETFPEEY